MRTVRKGVFETNSSSVHSLTICSKEDYEKWGEGELIFSPEFIKSFFTKEEMKERLRAYIPDIDSFSEEKLKEIMLEEGFFLTPTDFTNWYQEEKCLEVFEESYTTKNGEEIVAFGYFGRDG